jgi:hypothetical protein
MMDSKDIAAKVTRPLDLSNLLKHAFIAGRISAGASSSFHGHAWSEYDPTESAAYARICADLRLDAVLALVGLDGLQHVCNEGIFLECPTIPRQFEQAYARLAREGQKRQVNWRIAVANRTIQVKLHRDLLTKDATVVKVTGGVKTLREAIHGD